MEIKQHSYNTTNRGSGKMSYQKLWLLFLPILLVNGLFTRGSCLIPYQIFSLCRHVQSAAFFAAAALRSIVCGSIVALCPQEFSLFKCYSCGYLCCAWAVLSIKKLFIKHENNWKKGLVLSRDVLYWFSFNANFLIRFPLL